MPYPIVGEYCRFSGGDKPTLLVVIDTEEEFEWGSAFSRGNTSVQAMRYVHRIQSVFDEYKITPVYVIDYPVASQKNGYAPLIEISGDGRCIIGAHLHPWVNPPFAETLSRTNSFPGNLPRQLESEKLKMLSDAIAERFGSRPTVYKAGRYGVGPHTAAILEEQGFEIDMSVCPYMNYSIEGGPDFTDMSAWPYWFGRRPLLELPLTVGFTGAFRIGGAKFYDAATTSLMRRLHAPGILARLGLFNKVWLSPEGYLFSETTHLVRTLIADQLRVFSFAFHSPSLACGNTPYVRSQRDLDDFLAHCRRFFDFFFGELGGVSSTPAAVRNDLIAREATRAA